LYGHSKGGRKVYEDVYSSTGQTKITSNTVLKDPRSRFELHEVIRNGGFLKGFQSPADLNAQKKA
jgi:hypothetical protein